ncbi:hypothetical protein B0H17DRAFT_1151264 [Mycena rosella]|uniref:Uncharacterized protein n=1 Tax=Mycena rosella TaxID=1033263 RepID=A0AAD7BMD4_MYCRO|nr:hypothetical protein B0H17DRAFT_1151264 [Mycena rosella]
MAAKLGAFEGVGVAGALGGADRSRCAATELTAAALEVWTPFDRAAGRATRMDLFPFPPRQAISTRTINYRGFLIRDLEASHGEVALRTTALSGGILHRLRKQFPPISGVCTARGKGMAAPSHTRNDRTAITIGRKSNIGGAPLIPESSAPHAALRTPVERSVRKHDERTVYVETSAVHELRSERTPGSVGKEYMIEGRRAVVDDGGNDDGADEETE